jgi:predicted lipoprotein with Yx(FWY)xxD motif
MLRRAALMITILATSIMGCATAQTPPAPASVADTAKGKTLVDAKGMTLYTFDKDTTGKSACNGPCAQNWPPLMATTASGPANWTVVTRDDGAKQWAFMGKPLYTWVKDSKPGDTTGDGVNNNVWHVAHP